MLNRILKIFSAVIYINNNETLNDDIYEYNEISIPFLASLGNAIYDYELFRKRDKKPNLKPFSFQVK